jgi:VirE N-terminal domain
MSSGVADVQVNLFPNAYSPVPEATMALTEAIEAIRGGRYQRQVCEVRQVLATQGKRAYNDAKRDLPAFTLAGTFTPSRLNAHLQRHFGIVHGDLDHLGDLVTAKRAISGDPRTAYVFVSPSADGLKPGIRVPVVADDAGYKRV